MSEVCMGIVKNFPLVIIFFFRFIFNRCVLPIAVSYLSQLYRNLVMVTYIWRLHSFFINLSHVDKFICRKLRNSWLPIPTSLFFQFLIFMQNMIELERCLVPMNNIPHNFCIKILQAVIDSQ